MEALKINLTRKYFSIFLVDRNVFLGICCRHYIWWWGENWSEHTWVKGMWVRQYFEKTLVGGNCVEGKNKTRSRKDKTRNSVTIKAHHNINTNNKCIFFFILHVSFIERLYTQSCQKCLS